MRHATASIVLVLSLFVLAGCGEDTQLTAGPDPVDAPVTTSIDHPRIAEAKTQEALLARTAGVLDAELGAIARPAGGARPVVPAGGDHYDGALVVLPAGSADGLAAAIAAAGPRGVVVVASGLHTESGTVTITHPVSILGESGAVIEFTTTPGPVVEPALHLLDVPAHFGKSVTVWGVEIQAAGGAGETGILIEGTPWAQIGRSVIAGFFNAVLVERSDRAFMWENTIEGYDPNGLGITVINGVHARIYRNAISGYAFGIWACDRFGLAVGNVFTENLIGLIYCRVPAESFVLPSGEAVGADLPAVQWLASGNSAENNVWGYMIADGSNTSAMILNHAANNALYDVHVLPETEEVFGFCTPVVYDNLVILAPEQLIKDCGENTIVIGGTLSTDPCEAPCGAPRSGVGTMSGIGERLSERFGLGGLGAGL